MPKSDTLPLRRWPCWPGPYSRLLTGLFGRPQMFSPIRRSSLYLALLRFDMRHSSNALTLSPVPPASGKPGRATASSSAERRVGTEGVSTCRSRWAQYHKKINKDDNDDASNNTY